MKTTIKALWIGVALSSLIFLTSCGKQGSSQIADPDKSYAEGEWQGEVYADYEKLGDPEIYGPFDSDEQCIAEILDSGAVASDTAVFECCTIDPNYSGRRGKEPRYRVCRSNIADFQAEVCADPTDICNERGHTIGKFLEDARRDAKKRNQDVDHALKMILDPRASLVKKTAARDQFQEALYRLRENPLGKPDSKTGAIDRIRAETSLMSREEMETNLAAARDASSGEERAVYEDALTVVNRRIIHDALTDIVARANALIEGDASAPALAKGTTVDAIVHTQSYTELAGPNPILNGMTAKEIGERVRKLSRIGVIDQRRQADNEIYYQCDNGIRGIAYRIIQNLAAVDLETNEVIGVTELTGGPPPSEIKSALYQCEGAGEPPDSAKYLVVSD